MANTGHFLLKRGAWADTFLRAVYATYPSPNPLHDLLAEQNAAIFVLSGEQLACRADLHWDDDDDASGCNLLAARYTSEVALHPQRRMGAYLADDVSSGPGGASGYKVDDAQIHIMRTRMCTQAQHTHSIHIHTRTHARTHTRTHTHGLTHIFAFTRVRPTYTHMCIRISTHTHIHTYRMVTCLSTSRARPSPALRWSLAAPCTARHSLPATQPSRRTPPPPTRSGPSTYRCSLGVRPCPLSSHGRTS